MHENGSISVHTQNILPIIKQWLYSEKDIFLRELVSNGCDAITKYRKLVSLGEAEGAEEDYQVRVEVDEGQRIIRVIDTGIGMTEEEVKKYINPVSYTHLVISSFIGGFLGSMVNTVGVVLGMYFFFGWAYISILETTEALVFGALWAAIGPAGLAEAIIAGIASMAVCPPIRRFVLKKA